MKPLFSRFPFVVVCQMLGLGCCPVMTAVHGAGPHLRPAEDSTHASGAGRQEAQHSERDQQGELEGWAGGGCNYCIYNRGNACGAAELLPPPEVQL